MPRPASSEDPDDEAAAQASESTASSRVGRALWSVAAQGVASSSNVGVQFGLVVTLSAPRFGAVVVGFAVFYLALALGRAWVGDPLVAITETRADVDKLWPELRRRLITLGSVSTLVILLWSVVAEGVRAELTFLALPLPALLLQDGHRYRAWALRLYPRVVALDAAWLLTSALVVLAVVIVRGSAAVDGRVVMLAWVGGGVASWQLARVLAVTADPTGARSRSSVEDSNWDERHRASRSLTTQQAVLAVDANGLPVVVAAVANATVTAGIRTVVLPFAPMTSVLSGIRVLALPVLRQAVRNGHAGATVAKVVALYTAVAAAMSIAILAALAVVPTTWLGESGELVRTWFPLGAVVVAGRMIGLPMADVLSLGVAQARVATIRLITSAVDWTATLGGAVLIGLEGAIIGRAGAAVVSLGVWVVMVGLALHGGASDDVDQHDATALTVTGVEPQQ